MSRRARWSVRLISVAGFILLWDAAASLGISDPDLFPPFTRVLLRVVELAATIEFWARDVWGSLLRLVVAATLTVPVAVALGVLTGVSSRVHDVLSPFINFTLPLPKVAIFPLILAVFGIGDMGKIVLIAIGIFYPLFINVLNSVWRLNASSIQDVISIYRIRGVRLWVQVYLRGLVPDILTGLKTSLGYGFTLVVVSEFTASNNGLGNFIWRSWEAYQVLDMYAGVLYLCFFGWAVQSSLDWWLERELSESRPA
ncbi:MAG: ABC transporter permease [Bdellovibrionales bacterium]